MEYLEENLDEWLAEELEVMHFRLHNYCYAKCVQTWGWHTHQGWQVLLILHTTANLMSLLCSIGSSCFTRAAQCAYCFPSSICNAAAFCIISSNDSVHSFSAVLIAAHFDHHAGCFC